MPVYEFACSGCGQSFEARVRMDARPDNCPSCGSPDLHKQLSTFAAHTRDGASASPAPAGCGMGNACGRVTGQGCGGGFN